MNADQQDMKVTLPLLQTIAEQSDLSQRSIAQKLGLALGLTNNYLKRCVKKGLIKIEQVPSNRYLYFLTPQGLSEKTRLTAQYLNHSFHYYREVKQESEQFFKQMLSAGYPRVALFGSGEITEIAQLVSKEMNVALVSVSDLTHCSGGTFDAVVIADTQAPQQIFDALIKQFSKERIFCYRALGVVDK